MPVEVITRREPREATSDFDCKRCKSTLRFKVSEAATTIDRGELVYVVKCPVCESVNWLS